MKDPVLYAIPGFAILLFAELFYSWKSKRSLYKLRDTFVNLGSGTGSVIFGALVQAVPLAGYSWVYDHLRLITLSSGWVSHIAAFIGVDICYYAWHRANHRINFLWALHSVHHQSEEYNLSVALRQSWFSGLASWTFYLPLAILGVPFGVYATHTGLSLIYQFWIHTKLIERMGWLEGFLNTPSHHRVHHATNPQYIDKNYAGIFIVWDRLFGTFEKEGTAPRYGLTTPLGADDPIQANLYPWGILLKSAADRSLTFYERLGLFFNGPETLPH